MDLNITPISALQQQQQEQQQQPQHTCNILYNSLNVENELYELLNHNLMTYSAPN